MVTRTRPEYIIPVDFNAFRPNEFHSQWVGTEEQGIRGCYLIVTRVPPGTGTPSVHTHTGDQFYFIFKGEMNLRLGDQRHKAKAGDLVFIPCAVPHRNWNTTDDEEIHFEFIVPNAPPNLARSYRARFQVEDIPDEELKPAVDPHYVRSLDRSKFDANDISYVTLADYSSGSHHCRIDIFQVPPGKGAGELHVHTFDQVYYTMTGSMRLRLGEEEHSIVPNTYVYIPAGMPHTFHNDGAEMATHIHVQVPEEPASRASVPVRLRP